MRRKAEAKVEEEVVIEEGRAVEQEVEEVKGGDSITISGRTVKGAEVVRTFSKAIHGADFKKLATDFKNKVGGKIV